MPGAAPHIAFTGGWLRGSLRVDGVVKVLPGGVAFALQFLAALIPPCAQTEWNALRDDGEQVDFAAHLGDLDGGCQTRQPAAYTIIFGVAAILVSPLTHYDVVCGIIGSHGDRES